MAILSLSVTSLAKLSISHVFLSVSVVVPVSRQMVMRVVSIAVVLTGTPHRTGIWQPVIGAQPYLTCSVSSHALFFCGRGRGVILSFLVYKMGK